MRTAESGNALCALLAGAATTSLAGAAGEPAWREPALAGVAASCGVAAAAGLGLGLLARASPRIRLATGGALALGVALGAAPALAGAIGSPAGGLLAAAAIAALGLILGGRVRVARWALHAALAGALLVALGAAVAPPSLEPRPAPATGSPAGGRPDLVLVSVDTLRADALDDHECATALSALARRGVSAPFALAPSDTTLPSHVTMLSGLRVLDHGVADNSGRLLPGTVGIAERLHEAGYATAGVVSNYLLRGAAGFARGFDVYDEAPTVHAGPRAALEAQIEARTWWGWLGLERWLGPGVERFLYGRRLAPDGGHRGNGRHTTDDALALLAQLQRNTAPLFLFVHYMDPHTPYAPPTAVRARCGAAGQLPSRYRNGRAPRVDWRLASRVGRDLREGEPDAGRALDHLRELYRAEVAFVDVLLGELMAAIERGGRPTVVLVTADHGEQFGEHGLLTHGNSLYEPALRVPLVLAGAGVPAARLAHPPHLVDVAPTLLARAGLAIDELPGRDLLARPPAGDAPHLARRAPLVALRSGGWKLHLIERDDGSLEPTELFHLARDPGELRNRLGERPEVVERLASRARASFESRARPGSRLETSPAHRRALEALGYVDP